MKFCIGDVMNKATVLFLLMLLMSCFLGCESGKQTTIGIAFGVGPATRWRQEVQYMEAYAKTLGVGLAVRLNTDENKKPFVQDCFELIDSGIDVLIVRPRDVFNMKEVVAYARKKKVSIISYDSLIENEEIDLFIGYDSEYVGLSLARYLSEMTASGDYILIWGDVNRNVEDMYRGAMKCLEPLKNDINILLETGVPNWSPVEAKRIVMETVSKNGNKVSAILAFSDKLAGACAEAVAELGIMTPVYIAGMDAELDAVRRIVAGTQSCTAYMDLKSFSYAAIDQAINLANKKPIKHNYEISTGIGKSVPVYLLARQLVEKSNINRVLIQSGYYTNEEVYGP